MMRLQALLLCVALAASVFRLPAERSCRAAEPQKMLAHDVYFSLNDRSPQAKEKLIAACRKYLTGHPGTIWFAAGPLGEEFNREVNDRDFDVALHLVFTTKAAHDQYAEAERHMKFIEENEANWKKVRVFDSYVTVSSHEGMATTEDRPATKRKTSLPEAAGGFAGIVQGKVAGKFDGGFALKVERIVKEWEHNKAKRAKELVGTTVPIKAASREVNVARFVKILKAGEEIAVDVADKGGDALTILELTEDQRQRVKDAPAPEK